MNPTLFLGLVTHERTRFAEAQGPDGLVAALSEALKLQGTTTTVSIHDANHFDARSVPLTQEEVKASIAAELTMEERWRIYVSGRRSLGLRAFMIARQTYRRIRLAPPWNIAESATPQGARMLQRLVNIELAHMHLMAEAVAAGADWALIVEDDAAATNPAQLARDLLRFMIGRSSEAQPKYVNASRSFTGKPLGLRNHLQPVMRWDRDSQLMSADRPMTNTVCAVLYRTTFLASLLSHLEDIPISPVMPIDWKINAALMSMHERDQLGSGDCWFIEPAPLVQRSMHQ